MKRVFCDKCGAEIRDGIYACSPYEPLYNVEVYGRDGWEDVDLCKKCQAALHDWLQKDGAEKIDD